MFKQAKSIFFWSLVYKFRKRLTIVVVLLSTVLLSQWIYSDVVQYLTLTDKTEYLNWVLPLKWSVIFFNITLSSYLILTLFKSEKIDKPKEEIVEKITDKNPLSKREQEFMNKKIRTQAEIILQKKINQ